MDHPASQIDFPAYPFSATRFEVLAIEIAEGTTANFQIENGALRAKSMVWTQNGTSSTYVRQSDPNRLDCIVHGNVAILSMVGEDESEYSVEASSNLKDWTHIGRLSAAGEQLEMPMRDFPETRFFRATRAAATKPFLHDDSSRITSASQMFLLPSSTRLPQQ